MSQPKRRYCVSCDLTPTIRRSPPRLPRRYSGSSNRDLAVRCCCSQWEPAPLITCTNGLDSTKASSPSRSSAMVGFRLCRDSRLARGSSCHRGGRSGAHRLLSANDTGRSQPMIPTQSHLKTPGRLDVFRAACLGGFESARRHRSAHDYRALEGWRGSDDRLQMRFPIVNFCEHPRC